MTRSLFFVLFLFPATLAAQVYADGDQHGAVVQPRLAFTTTGAAFAWNFRGIHVAMDVTHGPVYAENQILLAGSGHNPAIASDGENALVVWNSGVGRPRRPQLLAALAGRGGVIARFNIAECDADTAPAARWNGASYVVAWRVRGALRTTVIDRFGNFLGEIHDVADAAPGYRVSVATDGDRSLVVTKDAFVVVDRDAHPIAQSAGGGHDVAWDGSEYFVVDADAAGVTGTRVSRDGVPLGAPARITSDAGHDPRVAWNGRDLEVLWLVDRALPFRPSVRLGRVGGDGIGEEIWSDRWIDADNFDLAAQPAGQTIIARGPAAALVVGVISFDIWMPPRRRTAA